MAVFFVLHAHGICSETTSWLSKLLCDVRSEPFVVSGVDTVKLKPTEHMREAFSLKANSCELEGHVRTSPFPLLLWLKVVTMWRKRSAPCCPEAANQALHTDVSHMLLSARALLLYSLSSESPVLYSEVTLWGRFVAIGAIIAIIWLSSTNLSNVIVLQDQFLEQDRFLSAFLGNLGQQASHFSPEMEA